MGGSSKLDRLKAMQKEGKKGIVVDKTFGLKIKNKSKKVQQFCKQVQETQKKELFEELAGRQGMTMEQLNSAFQTATARPHGFLFISYNAPPGEKLWSGFSKKLVNK